QDDVQKSGGFHVSFTEKDSTASMPVDYTGTLPDIFKPGITVVAEGTLGADGVFHARTLLAKCPSRFSTSPYTQGGRGDPRVSRSRRAARGPRPRRLLRGAFVLGRLARAR